jgi:hypothetical protein
MLEVLGPKELQRMKKYSLIMLLALMMAMPLGAQTAIRRPLQNRGIPQQNGSPAPVTPMPAQGWNDSGTVVSRGMRNDVMAAPMFKFSMLGEEPGFLAGGKLGWIINHSYLVGLEGYWLVNDVPGPSTAAGQRPDLTLSYGGITLEYILLPQDMVHFSFSTLAGIGAVRYDDGLMEFNDTYWLVEPSLNTYLNLTQYLQLGLGVGYRYVGDVDLVDLEDEDLSGFSATLSVNFGTYGETLIPNH